MRKSNIFDYERRPIKISAVIRPNITNPTIHAKRAFGNRKPTIEASYPLNDLWKAVSDYIELPLLRDPSKEEIRNADRFIYRAGLLKHCGIFRSDYSIPRFETFRSGPVNHSRIEEKLGDGFDAAILRMRPFLHHADLPAEEMIREVASLKIEDPESHLVKTILSYFNMEHSRVIREVYFAKFDDKGVMVSYTTGIAGNIIGKARFQAYYSESDPDPLVELSPDHEATLLKIIEDLKEPFRPEGRIRICNITHHAAVKKWLEKVEYHDSKSEKDVGYFEKYFPTRVFSPLIRISLMHHMHERFYALMALERMIVATEGLHS